MATPIPAPERFWPKVVKHPGGCWEWTGAKHIGYGRFMVRIEGRKRTVTAHRFAYEQLVGPVPEGLELDHLCRNPSCVNPEHLEPVTHRENQLRGVRGRMVTVCANGHPYTEENTFIRRDGRRRCRICIRENGARSRARRAGTCSDCGGLVKTPGRLRCPSCASKRHWANHQSTTSQGGI